MSRTTNICNRKAGFMSTVQNCLLCILMTNWDYISAVFNGPIVHLPDDRCTNMDYCWTGLQNRGTWRKTYHSAHLSNINPTLNDLGLSPGLWDEIPTTVNFDTALTTELFLLEKIKFTPFVPCVTSCAEEVRK